MGRGTASKGGAARSGGGEFGKPACGLEAGEVIGVFKLSPTEPAAEDGSRLVPRLADGRREEGRLPEADATEVLRSRVEAVFRPATNMRGWG